MFQSALELVMMFPSVARPSTRARADVRFVERTAEVRERPRGLREPGGPRARGDPGPRLVPDAVRGPGAAGAGRLAKSVESMLRVQYECRKHSYARLEVS